MRTVKTIEIASRMVMLLFAEEELFTPARAGCRAKSGAGQKNPRRAVTIHAGRFHDLCGSAVDGGAGSVGDAGARGGAGARGRGRRGAPGSGLLTISFGAPRSI
jgi:hypothetical protein